MTTSITPLIFVGGSRATPVEALIADAHEAIAADLLEQLSNIPIAARPIVATSSVAFAALARGQNVDVIVDSPDFHFGRVLSSLIERYDIRRAFYLGGGSTPLLTVSAIEDIIRQVSREDDCLVANNFFSCDFVAFSPATAIQRIRLPSIDNDLAYRLHHEAGLKNIVLPRTTGTQMDVDTPTDLSILTLHPGVGPHLRAVLDRANLDAERVQSIGRTMTDPTAEVVIAGRVGSYVLAHLESDAACRTRVFSEERGMRANGREARGQVRSLLGYHLAAVGPRQFFRDLAELGNAALIDTRVLFHHLGLMPSASDRFLSDLLRPADIADPTVREFTQAALDAPLPVLLGGHSLVAGGLWALIDAAWLERDRAIGGGPAA
ncbi:MAG TPA: hypothetical protein VKT80_14940 [Chloroflexota bacterium]|nr:hypothetical protein [Chloroflexota bacterium]